MVCKVTELVKNDLAETAKRVLALAEHLYDRPLPGKSLIFVVEPQLHADQRDQVLCITAIKNRKPWLYTDRPAIAPQQKICH